jgi:non-specific serine/threonine protein kinase
MNEGDGRRPRCVKIRTVAGVAAIDGGLKESRIFLNGQPAPPYYASMIFRFGDCELDESAYELRRGGRRLRLARQPMDLLRLLLEHPGQLVARDFIASQLWAPDSFGDLDAGIHTAILRIRQVLGDSRQSPAFIETVPGKGYRFIASVEVAAEAERSTSMPLDNLPAELTSFVGREQELAALPRLLSNTRLMTLTGAGGVGKTRLAMRLASAVASQYPEGIWLVDLAPLTAPDLIAQTIATALGVRESANRPVRDALFESVRHRRMLLLLDTCEHLIDACAEIAEALLRTAPLARIVCTSREALGVPGEIVYRVPSLSLPEAFESMAAEPLAAGDAVQLFAERAAALDPHFSADGGNVAAIARICRRLDGIPLAIELAAARVAVLSLAQIEARLQDRFRLLAGSTRTAVARQRTLEATIDWSYHLLSDAERLLLNRLSVFPASWTLQAAEHICAGHGIETADMLDLLSRLAGKSLVALESDFDDERRYRLLETVRQYGRDRLVQNGDADRVQQRHFEFFFDEFRSAQRTLRGRGQVGLLRRLRIEQENVRGALAWALESPAHVEQGVELAGALFWYWTKRGLFEEGRLWLARAVALPARASLRARALIGLAHMQDFQGHHAAAAASADAALSLGRAAGDPWVVSVALFMQSLAAFQLGDRERATDCAQAARQAADAGCDIVEHGGPLLILANLALAAGDHDRAQTLFAESIEVHRRGADAWGLAILLSLAAGLRIVRGDFAQAGAHAAEALALSEALEDPRGVAWSFEVIAGLLAATGDADAAVRVWGASDGLLEGAGGSVLPTIGWIRERYMGPVRTSLGEERFTTIRTEGRALARTQAVAFAREHARLLS